MSSKDKVVVAATFAILSLIALTGTTPDVIRLLLLSQRFQEHATALVEGEQVRYGQGSLVGFPSDEAKYRYVTYVFALGADRISGDWWSLHERGERHYSVPRPVHFRGERVQVCYSRLRPAVNALHCGEVPADVFARTVLLWVVSAGVLGASVVLGARALSESRREER